MPRKAIPSPYTLTENVDACKVLITFDTGRRTSNYPYDPIIERLEVSLDDVETFDRGKQWEKFCYRLLRFPGDHLANWQGRESVICWMDDAQVSKAEIAVRRLWTEHDRATERGRQTWQYKLIAAEATRIGWPALYAEDLTNHDAYTLGTRQPTAFLWMLRECGTWLHTDDTGAEWLQAEVKQSGDRAHYYHVTHAGLRKLTPEKFAAFRFAS